MSRHARQKAAEARRKKRTRMTIIGGVAAVAVVAALILLLWPWGTGGVVDGSPLTSPDQVQRISPEDAKELIDRGDAVLYDVRSRAAYELSHAGGAIALPEDELVSLIPSLPPDKTLILYCT